MKKIAIIILSLVVMSAMAFPFKAPAPVLNVPYSAPAK